MHPSRAVLPLFVFSLLSVVRASRPSPGPVPNSTGASASAGSPASSTPSPSVYSSDNHPSRVAIIAAAVGTIIGAILVAFVAYLYRRRYRSPFPFRSKKANLHGRGSSTAFLRVDSPHEADPGRAQLEEEVEDLRRKVARLEAERVAAGLPPSLDAPTRGGANGTDIVHLGEKDEAATRAYTRGLATMGRLQRRHQSTRDDHAVVSGIDAAQNCKSLAFRSLNSNFGLRVREAAPLGVGPVASHSYYDGRSVIFWEFLLRRRNGYFVFT
ncbi:hypothetical protein C8J57DRAFT_1460623 [Mycena rebaudengoi]|nr:hypothetical protein C8J57DRAFT_1460623 [Mycena rebaudengoi]